MAKVIIKCDGIACDEHVELDIPDWVGEIEAGGEGSYLYCPKCILQRQWFSAQCPGCVEGFSGCTFSRAFMYGKNELTQGQVQQIERGKCPFRTNGTFGFTLGKKKSEFETINLSDIAPVESGLAVLEAVRLYGEKYYKR